MILVTIQSDLQVLTVASNTAEQMEGSLEFTSGEGSWQVLDPNRLVDVDLLFSGQTWTSWDVELNQGIDRTSRPPFLLIRWISSHTLWAIPHVSRFLPCHVGATSVPRFHPEASATRR